MIKVKVKSSKDKESFYIGVYNSEGKQVIKIGTTNNLKRREAEHKRGICKLKNYPGTDYRTLWELKLSKANALKVEEQMRKKMKEHPSLRFIANDRFAIESEVPEIELTVRKTYKIPLGELLK